jgi:pimeloyl-ACP methyl ester carboxylesterase
MSRRSNPALGKQLAGASVVRMPDCGHYLQEDCPDKVEKEVVEFLGRVFV